MHQSPPRLVTFVLLTAMTVVTTNMFLPALPAMQADFEVSAAVIGLAISAYMAAAAVLQLVLGPVSDRVGRRPVILGALAVYVLASVVCIFAPGIGVFLVARVVQAVAVAGGVLASAMVRDVHDGPRAAQVLALIASAMAIAPMLAPALGGLIEVWLGWRAVFALYAALGAGLLLWGLTDLRETLHPEAAAQREPFSRLLREKRFWALALCQSMGVGAFYVFLTGAPFVAAGHFGLDAAQIGIGLGSITLGFLLGASLSARIVMRTGAMRLVFAGRYVALGGLSLGLALFAVSEPPVWVLFAVTIWVGAGNGLTLANANALALSVRPRLAGTAAGAIGALGNLTGAVLAALATAALSGQATPVRLIAIMALAVGLSLIAALAARRWETEQS